MELMRKGLAALLIAGGLMSVAACENTVEGVGQDMEQSGEWLQDQDGDETVN